MENAKKWQKKLDSLGHSVGVYFFKDVRGRIIYIGKAVDLKARVKSYFIKNSLYGIKVAMLPEIAKIDYKTTETEIDALILESQLIKKHRPKYNVLLKDDKNYFYVVFTSEQFPKIFITHQPHGYKSGKLSGILHEKTLDFSQPACASHVDRREKSRSVSILSASWRTARTPNVFLSKIPESFNFVVLGPYTDGQALKTTLRYLRRIFPYCTCKNQHKIPCLKSHLGLCLGVCCLKQQSKSQNSAVILSPANRRTKNLGDPSRSPFSSEAKGFTILGMTEKGGASFEMTYKKNIKSIIDILSGKRKNILKKMEKEMKTAAKNEDFENAIKLRDKISAMENIFQHKINDVGRHYGRPTSLEGAKSELDRIFDAKIRRIEFYDISNISGQLATGSMVVFDNGKADKSHYRKFKIKTVFGPDDPAMMQEVLKRRLKHAEWSLPDLIIVDGGIAQFNAAKAVILTLSEAKEFTALKMTKIASLAKNPDRLFLPPHLKTPYNSIKTQYFLKRCGGESPIKQIALKDLNENARLLLQNLRDEAHRFAINYHKKLRSKKLKEEFIFRQKKTTDF